MKKLIINTSPPFKRIVVSVKAKKQNTNLLSCKFCLYWAKKKWVGGEENSFRCSEKGISIFSEHHICDKFKIATLFWCHKSRCFMYIAACIKRQNEKGLLKQSVWAQCKNCVEGKNLLQHLESNLN